MNTYRIALWGNGAPLKNCIPILCKNGIEIAYVKLDRRRDDTEAQVKEIEGLGIKCYVDEYPTEEKVDMIFVNNYSRIIPEEVLNKFFTVNYHIGVLPKWRGSSANGWGVISGDNYVGYTIHKVLPMLDAGPIYYQFKYPYHEGETYYEARKAMNEDFDAHVADIIKDILNGTLKEQEPADSEFVYCVKFRPADGVISNWNIPTDEIIRRFYVFGPPLGTGLKFNYNDKTYEIKHLSRIKGFANSIGVPGSVVYKYEGALWVKTADSAIAIDNITLDGVPVDIESEFRMRMRLGR